MTDALEEHIQSIGREIFDRALRHKAHTLKVKDWEAQVLTWCLKDPKLKVKILRFVDVLPALKTHRDIIDHMKEYFPDTMERLPLPLRLGRALAGESLLTGRAAAYAVRWAVRRMALHFIAAEDIEEACQVLKKMEEGGASFTIDLLGEAVTSELEADEYTNRVVNLIQTLAKTFGDRANVSIKPSALYSQFDPVDTEGTVHAVKQRLAHILKEARAARAFVCLDMEQYTCRDLVVRIFKETLGEKEFLDTEDAGIAIQAYHRDAERVLVDLIEWAKKRRTPVSVRLVKGAYWDYEVIHARQNNWPTPVFVDKHDTDISFERLTALLLENHAHVHAAIASHNVRSIAHAAALKNQLGLGPKELEFQVLYGMADPIQEALIEMGLPVRVYTPFGELIPGMGYLVRRLLENTSNESFLRQGFLESTASPEILLRDPLRSTVRAPKPQIILDEGTQETEGIPSFQNEPPLDFSHEDERRRMREAIQAAHHECGKTLPLRMMGQDVQTNSTLQSTNPADLNEIIATVSCAGVAETDAAIEAARKAQTAWAQRGVRARAEILFKTAEGMRRHRFDLAALEVLEVGKGWREADADVCEAIDYLDYYGRQAIRLFRPAPIQQVPGETNDLVCRPLGVGAVIAPWNFPLAILTGMTSAAIVTGNAVVMKPAEQSPAVARKLMDLFEEAGLPDGVLNYLPGRGEEAGARLIESPSIKFIAFTGSREVGLAIRERVGQLKKGEQFLKRLITEMGGKNAIIVDKDADLDEAVLGVIHSAFGYQGQKCSACSRAILLSDIHDTFLKRLVEAAKSLRVGRPEKPSTFLGPLIDAAALEKAREYARIAASLHTIHLEYPQANLPQEGPYFGPLIVSGVTPESPLAQDEIFAPILAVMRASDFDEAVQMANSTAYALTGGVYTRNPAHIKKVNAVFEAGNIYINRSITGAVVGRQPFGGFKLSGTGLKAGGPRYLDEFVLAQTISENTLRHGFAPL
ncbi:MAG: bifunctional proline dehydrogenase/L-glutamate gamma-semialdehyde dehydrogenase [Candidatus Omnitrophica bacterium]|nr:bifunctional proline dehydrogenase/L-glutamate gamma-semialdehyde dehydrogenase [Candidatus Omnitrophota bacterium]